MAETEVSPEIKDNNSPLQNEPNLGASKTVEIDTKQDHGPETIDVKVTGGSGSLKDLLKKKAKASTAEQKDPMKDDDKQESDGERRERIKEDEKKLVEQFTFKDYEKISSGIVEGIDLLLAFILRWVAGDTTSEPYTMPVEDKRRLSGIWANVLFILGKKFPLWAVALFVSALCLMQPVKNAMDNRKIIKAKKKKAAEEEEKLSNNSKGDPDVKQEQKTTMTVETEDGKKEEVVVGARAARRINSPKLRKQGRVGRRPIED